MPQQPAGPFSQYLTEPIKSQVPNPTGFEGNAAAYAHVGAKFLEGLRQGRLQKAAMAEMENARTERALEQAIHHVSSIEGVDPAIKQHYQNQLVQQYLGHIAGQKETSKDTGHPVTDMLKNVALNLSGGQLPGKKAGLDLNLVGEAMTALNDPSNRVDQRLSRLNSDLSAALQSGNVTDIRTAYANPQVAQYLNEGRRLTGRADWTPDVFQSLAPDAIKSEQEKLQLGVLKSPQFQSAMTGSQQRLPQTSPPPMGASDVGAEAPTGPPPTAGVNTSSQTPATTQPPGPRNFLSVVTAAQQAEANRTWQSKVAGTQLPPSDNVIPKIGNPESYVDASGNPFNGVFNPSKFEEFNPGVYDATTGEARPNARKSALYNPEQGRDRRWANNAPGEAKYLVERDPKTGAYNPVRLPDGSLITEYSDPKVVNSEVQDPQTGAISNSSRTLFQQRPPSVPGVSTPAAVTPAATPRAATTPPPGSSQPKATTAQAPVPAQSQAAQPAPARTAAAPVSGGSFKRASTVPPQQVVDSYSDDLEAGIISPKQLTGMDKFGQRAAIDPVVARGSRPLTEQNIARINAIHSVANDFLPSYERMIGLLSKEKNPQIQYINGMISNKFTNPELQAAVEDINSKITNLAKTIGGEVRGVTDADAKRMLGYGPQKGYTVALNQQLLDRFKKTLVGHITSDIPGLSDNQLSKIGARRGGVLNDLIVQHIQEKQATKPTAQPAPAKLMGGKTNPFRQGATAAQPVVTIKAKP